MTDTTALAQKTAVHFSKIGPAVYHSHHDMIRFWERAVKRAGLPLRMTQGFNPHPRIVFPHALGLGIVSLHEEVELELHARVDTDELLKVLTIACGDALPITGAENLPPVKKSRRLAESSYRIAGWPVSGPELADAAAEILAMPEIPVVRGAPRERRSLDIRPYVLNLSLDGEGGGICLTFRHTAAGSGRPDEIAELMACRVGCDAHDLGIEKVGMTLE